MDMFFVDTQMSVCYDKYIGAAVVPLFFTAAI